MYDNLQQLIEGVGFRPKEAVVYLATLELDGSTNAQIAKKTRLNRITNYEILKRLIKQGVVVAYKRKSGQYFLAVDPRVVLKQAKEKLALAEQAMPQFLSIANKLEKKPKIYFFEDLTGIKTLYDDSLNAKTEILTITNATEIRSVFGGKYIDNYVRERIKRKIYLKGLVPNDSRGQVELKISPEVYREVRLYPADKFVVHNEILIYDEKLAVFSAKDEIGLIIENKTLAESFRAFWQMAWQNAEKF